MGSSDRRAVSNESRLDVDVPSRRAVGTDASDPYLAAWLGQLHLQTTALNTEHGIVVDAIPAAHAYRVLAGHQSYLWCSLGASDASFASSGVKPTDTIPLLTRVRFVRNTDAPHTGTIVGTDPHWSVHTGFQPAETIWPFVRSGTYTDVAHTIPLTASIANANSGSIPLVGTEAGDWSAGRPYDATTAGEWGRRTETGLGLFLDPWQVQLRVDETTGVFGFYADSLLRVAGHNYQEYTCQSEREDLEDEGELTGWTRNTIYPWEPIGLWRHNQVTPNWTATAANNNGLAGGQGIALIDPATVQAGSGYGTSEPEMIGQLSAPRYQSWSGYLGQGGHRVHSAPAQLAFAYPSVPVEARDAVASVISRSDAPSGRLGIDGVYESETQPFAVPPNSYSGPDQPALHEDHVSLTGARHISTARRFIITKRYSRPTPRPLRRPEDPGGDSPNSGYSPSGLIGNSAVHKVTSDPTPTTDPGRRMCQLPDALAYMFNWENLHPFVYHTADWHVAEEGAAGTVATNQIAPEYDLLRTQQYLESPAPVFLDVDHRYGFAAYYETESVFAMLDDGSIVLRDGCGGEIRMGGGSIDIRAAGDVRIHTGRGVLIWGGDDVVVKAHKSIDLTAENGDLRTMAAFNNHHLAGNSGCGGFLFETKSTCPANAYTGRVGEEVGSSGFTVLCPESQFVVTAGDATVRLADGAAAAARITLDAGTTREIHSTSKRTVSRIATGGAALTLFDVGGALELTSSYALWSGDLAIGGGGLFTGCLSSAASVQCAGRLFDEQTVDASSIAARVTYLNDTYLSAFTDQTAVAPGTDDAEFSLRNADQYNSTSFVYWAAHWEAVAAADAQALEPWTGAVVTGLVSMTQTRPFPGERWTEAGSYMSQSYSLVDSENGWIAIGRTANVAAYESAETPDPTPGTLDARYPVIVPLD